MFKKKTLSSIDVKDKKVLLRADLNVPLENGKITNDYRIKKSLPTIKALLEQKAKIIICSHLGRPDGKKDESLSLEPVSKRLMDLLQEEVDFVETPIGEDLEYELRKNKSQIVLLENLRFYPEEEANDASFAKHLASLADIQVQDAFAAAHRDHASMTGVAKHIPAVAGLLVQEEVSGILKATQHPRQPLVLVVGGAKIATKLPLLNNLMKITKRIIIGGAMANTFFLAKDMEVGKSLVDESEIKDAKEVIEKCNEANVELVLPLLDVAVGDKVEDGTKRREIDSHDVGKNDIILDFGEKSISSVSENLNDAKTVIWNGPIGMVELKQFATGSEDLALTLSHLDAEVIVGGGDTAGFVENMNLLDSFTLVSTGGGASLELMSGKKLPAIEALLDK